MLKGLLATGAACALVGGVALAGHAAQTPGGGTVALTTTPAATVATAAGTTARLQAAAAADDVAGLTAATAGKKERCERLPTRIARTQKLEQVLAADASTKGSIDYLRAWIQEATAAHHEEQVEALNRRLEFRTALQGFLPQRLELLKTASTTICAPAGGSAAS
jgi:hypothetical protein